MRNLRDRPAERRAQRRFCFARLYRWRDEAVKAGKKPSGLIRDGLATASTGRVGRAPLEIVRIKPRCRLGIRLFLL
jgi:hypothetical protein